MKRFYVINDSHAPSPDMLFKKSPLGYAENAQDAEVKMRATSGGIGAYSPTVGSEGRAKFARKRIDKERAHALK